MGQLYILTRRGWGVSVIPRPQLTPRKDPVPIFHEAGWASGPVWTGAENLAPTGIRSPDRPARSSVATPTELLGPLKRFVVYFNYVISNCYATKFIDLKIICFRGCKTFVRQQ